MYRQRFFTITLALVAIIFIIGVAQSKTKLKVFITPQGQTLTLTGEAYNHSEWLERGRQMGFTDRAPHRAWVLVEELRAGNLIVAGAIDLTKDRGLVWPAGQWVTAILSDSTELRARRIFTCGPRNAMPVFDLGRETRRLPADALHGAQVPGVKYFANPIYIAFPYTKVLGRNGKFSEMGFSDIVEIRFVNLSPDSLTAVMERR